MARFTMILGMRTFTAAPSVPPPSCRHHHPTPARCRASASTVMMRMCHPTPDLTAIPTTRGPGYGAACVPREVIRERLTRHGWQDFHDGALQGEVAVVRARRPSGRLFELTIERCSGEIVSAYPLESRVYGPYAYGPRPWWQRPY